MGTKPVAAPEALRSRIVGHGTADPAALIANPRNWRTHPPEQRAALLAELDRVGFVQSVIVNKTTGHLVDGHLRVEVAAERGAAQIPVVYVELSEDEEARVLVALDPLASMAGTNDALLQDLLDTVDLENRALEDYLVSLMPSGRRGTTEPDAVPPTPDESDVYVKPGDVWVLGEHRIMCGDSTNAEDVARLMDGQTASLMATDPPYLVNYQGGDHPASGNMNHKPASKDKHWDDYTDPETGVAFYVGFVAAAKPHLIERVPVYQWHATTVWTISQAGEQDGIHPTQKPVEIFHRPIEWHTRPGEVVYEPFSGSGTQIIAAERLGRRCFAMDLSPAFVQVAITRWQEFTGREAVRG